MTDGLDQDLLDQPAGDFDWGPDTSRWRRDRPAHDRVSSIRRRVMDWWPTVAVMVGAALLTLALTIGWWS